MLPTSREGIEGGRQERALREGIKRTARECIKGGQQERASGEGVQRA